MTKETLKMAQLALQNAIAVRHGFARANHLHVMLEERALTVVQEALAQPEQEPAVPDAINHTDLSETFEYIQGWNDCRQAMLAEQPEQKQPTGKEIEAEFDTFFKAAYGIKENT